MAETGAPVSVVGAIIEHPQEGYLLQLRDEAAPTDPLHWGLFGGHVEPGEDAELALWRELDEELRFDPAQALSCRLVQQNPWRNGGTQTIYHLRTLATPADWRLGEGKEMRFFRPEALAGQPFSANIGQVLAEHLAGRRDHGPDHD